MMTNFIKKKILIVDNNPNIHKDFQKILNACLDEQQPKLNELKELLFQEQNPLTANKLEIDAAYRGSEALEMVQLSIDEGYPYQVIFMDIHMPPGWDGIETCQKIFKMDPNVQVVICSAYNDYSWSQMKEKLGHLNRWLILKKPFDAIEIEQLVYSLIEKWYLNQKKQLEFENIEELISERTLELEESISQLKATLEVTTNAIFVLDQNYKLINYNKKFIEMWNPPEIILLSHNGHALIHYIADILENSNYFKDKFENLSKMDHSETFDELFLVDKRYIECYSHPQIINKRVTGRIWSFRDLSLRKKFEELNKLQNRAFEESPDGILIFNIENENPKIIYSNSAFRRITGFNNNEILNNDLKKLLNITKEQHNFFPIDNAFHQKKEAQAEFYCHSKSGERIWLEFHIAPVFDKNNFICHFVAIVIDITDKKRMIEQLSFQATHDLLTGLPNRNLLMDRIQQAIAYAKRLDLKVAILFMDFDRFKLVNDTLGHDIGDKLLKEIADRLTHNLRQNDTAARLGGDEFVIVLSGINETEEAIAIAQKILKSVSGPCLINGLELSISASIGISLYPENGLENQTLLKNADAALYYSKNQGGNIYQFYAEEMSKKTSQQLIMENELRQALERNEFILLYQPMFNGNSQKIIGVEALLRWQHPKEGLLLPGEFLSIAENSGLIIQIGEWVLRQACTQNKIWQNIGISPFKIAVNISAQQFEHSRFVQIVENILEETRLDPCFLELELTENIIMKNTKSTVMKMLALKEKGINFVVDDFGTGYSSLNYIRQLPFDKIKIDRSFIQEILTSSDDLTVLLAIIGIANSLEIETIAEGVETQTQLDYLKAQNMNGVQGFLLSQPLNETSCTDFLRKY